MRGMGTRKLRGGRDLKLFMFHPEPCYHEAVGDVKKTYKKSIKKERFQAKKLEAFFYI